MKVLFDTNVILDHLLAREPHAHVAEQLLNLVDTGCIDGLVCATTVTTIHYLAAKAAGAEAATLHMRELLAMFSVAPVDAVVLQSALQRGFADYEDAVLHEAAHHAGAQAIVTRNGKDFQRAHLPILSPPELLAAVLAGGTGEN